MIDEIFNLMECFEGCFVNRFGELIISDRGNVYFTAKGCKDKTDIICKLLEWCSRPIAKGTPYASAKRNQEWREKLLEGYNKYLGTHSHKLICTGYMTNWEMRQTMSLH